MTTNVYINVTLYLPEHIQSQYLSAANAIWMKTAVKYNRQIIQHFTLKYHFYIRQSANMQLESCWVSHRTYHLPLSRWAVTHQTHEQPCSYTQGGIAVYVHRKVLITPCNHGVSGYNTRQVCCELIITACVTRFST